MTESDGWSEVRRRARAHVHVQGLPRGARRSSTGSASSPRRRTTTRTSRSTTSEVTLRWWTHTAGGITDRDRELAEKTNALVASSSSPALHDDHGARGVIDDVPAHRAEKRGREPRAATRADDQEVRLRLGLETPPRIVLDEQALDLEGSAVGKASASADWSSAVGGVAAASRARREGRPQGTARDRTRRTPTARADHPGVKGNETRVAQLRLVGRQAQRGERRLRAVDPDDDRAGHGLSLYRGRVEPERASGRRRRAARRAPERAGRPHARGSRASSSDGSPEPASRDRGRELRRPRRVPQMAGAEEVVAALERVEGVAYAGPRAERAGLRPTRRLRARRGAVRLRRDRVVQPAEPERVGRGVARRREAHRRARAGRRHPARGDDQRRLRLPVRGGGRRGPRARARGRGRRGEARHAPPRGHDRRRRPRPGAAARLARGGAAGARRRPLPQHAEHGLRERARRAGVRGDACSTPPSVASAAARSRRRRPGTSRPRISSTCSSARGSRPGIDLDALIARLASGWKACSAGSSKASSTERARSRRRRSEQALRTGKQDRSAHLAELDIAGAAAQHDLVAVLEERPRRSRRRAGSDARRSASARSATPRSRAPGRRSSRRRRGRRSAARRR